MLLCPYSWLQTGNEEKSVGQELKRERSGGGGAEEGGCCEDDLRGAPHVFPMKNPSWPQDGDRP